MSPFVQELLLYSLKLRDLSSSASVIFEPPNRSLTLLSAFVIAKLGSIGRRDGAADYAFGMLHGVFGVMVDGQQELQNEDFVLVLLERVKIDSFWTRLNVLGSWLLRIWVNTRRRQDNVSSTSAGFKDLQLQLFRGTAVVKGSSFKWKFECCRWHDFLLIDSTEYDVRLQVFGDWGKDKYCAVACKRRHQCQCQLSAS